MREILFRGKRADNGEWVESGNVFLDGKKKHIYIPNPDTDMRAKAYLCVEVIPETIGQYTGLTDKNGKRIFEGDICQYKKTGRTVLVAWHGTMAGFVWNKKEDSSLYDFGELFRVHDKYEVIGNIHDNPELLKGDNDEV